MKKHIERMIAYIKKHARVATILLFLGLAGLGVIVGLSSSYEESNSIIANTPFWRTVAYILVNIAPELAGIAVGFVTIDYLNEGRQDEQLKRQLILQMGSSHNDVTDTAVRVLQSYEWLYDGTLKKANLIGANLRGIDFRHPEKYAGEFIHMEGSYLSNANLEGANLSRAHLEGSYFWIGINDYTHMKDIILWHAHLEDSILLYADLRGAELWNAHLERTDFGKADMEGAKLGGAYLTGTGFYGTNLKGADFRGAIGCTRNQLLEAKSLEGAIMPDGRLYEEWVLDDEEE